MTKDEIPVVYGPMPPGTEVIAIDQDVPDLPAADYLPDGKPLCKHGNGRKD